jgi:hypothetical protein
MRHPVGAGHLDRARARASHRLVNGPLVVGLRLNASIAMPAGLILLPGVTLGFTNGQALFDLQKGGGSSRRSSESVARPLRDRWQMRRCEPRKYIGTTTASRRWFSRPSTELLASWTAKPAEAVEFYTGSNVRGHILMRLVEPLF